MWSRFQPLVYLEKSLPKKARGATVLDSVGVSLLSEASYILSPLTLRLPCLECYPLQGRDCLLIYTAPSTRGPWSLLGSVGTTGVQMIINKSCFVALLVQNGSCMPPKKWLHFSGEESVSCFHRSKFIADISWHNSTEVSEYVPQGQSWISDTPVLIQNKSLDLIGDYTGSLLEYLKSGFGSCSVKCSESLWDEKFYIRSDVLSRCLALTT